MKMVDKTTDPAMDISHLLCERVGPKGDAIPLPPAIDVTPLSHHVSDYALQDRQRVPSLVPAWMLPPLNDALDSAINREMCPYLSAPELIRACPDRPSPLALLHGSRRNYLANKIYESLKKRHCRDPELLAIGWLMYVYCKWRVCLTAELFEQIPAFFRPVMGQLRQLHPYCMDVIIWPQLRLNMISQWQTVNLNDMMNLLACCLKVRWAWGDDILELDDQDDLHVRKEFYDKFTSESGWGLTSEFIQQYPNIFQDMDISQLLYIIES